MKTKFTLMKLIVIAIVSLALSIQVQAQPVMYGLTSSGGSNGVGTMFSITPSGNLSVVSNLNSTYVAAPEGSLLYASDGNFYASSYEGGWDDSCTIWCCSAYGGIRTVIDLFSIWGNSDPEGNSLIQAMDGNMYGMVTLGGDGYGVLFQLGLNGQYSALHFFTGADGYAPYGSLIQAPDGSFWGMTSSGGNTGAGNIFTYTLSGGVTSVYSFVSGTDGSAPYGDLLLANDGNFYGLTYSGGKYNYGTLFRYSQSGTFTKLVDFNDTNGAHPFGSLIQASDGNLYGLTSNGGAIDQNSGLGYGTLFGCTLSGNLTSLLQFNGTTNGKNPDGSLMQASDGNLYGMTSGGGESGNGTIFEYSLSHVYTKLCDFNGTNGSTPVYGKMIEADNVATGVNNISNTTNSNIYPNPNNGSFTLIFNHPIASADASTQPTLNVYNEIGEKVYGGMLNGAQFKNEISIGNQPSGVYFYRVTDGSGSIISNGRFVIQK